jgi:hypothetical protein
MTYGNFFHKNKSQSAKQQADWTNKSILSGLRIAEQGRL